MKRNRKENDNDHSTSLEKFFKKTDEESAIEERKAEAALKEKEMLEKHNQLMRERRIAKFKGKLEEMTPMQFYQKYVF
jgi:hypothetical protein